MAQSSVNFKFVSARALESRVAAVRIRSFFFRVFFMGLPQDVRRSG